MPYSSVHHQISVLLKKIIVCCNYVFIPSFFLSWKPLCLFVCWRHRQAMRCKWRRCCYSWYHKWSMYWMSMLGEWFSTHLYPHPPILLFNYYFVECFASIYEEYNAIRWNFYKIFISAYTRNRICTCDV